MSKTKLALSLGDIIQIIAPSNTEIHKQIFLITYLDDNKIKLIDSAKDADKREIEISINEGKLSDETIENARRMSVNGPTASVFEPCVK